MHNLFQQIIGAGILHGEKSPAVQTVMMSPLLSSVNISHSASDGINIISPGKFITIDFVSTSLTHWLLVQMR